MSEHDKTVATAARIAAIVEVRRYMALGIDVARLDLILIGMIAESEAGLAP